MTFAKRIINLRFVLGTGDFGQSGQNTVDIEGLRCTTTIVREGIGFSRADIQIWGMTLDQMNKLTVLNKVRYEQQRYNQVIISAGDEVSGVGVCFGGTIREAWAEGRNPPDVEFIVSADSAQFVLMKPVPPTSYQGSVSAALMISSIAQEMGYRFENSGVTATLNDPYKPGTFKSQIESICRDVNCHCDVNETTRTVAIWPKNGSRDGQAITVSKDTGLVGYPSFTQAGIQFSTIYNPNIEFGRMVEMKSQFQNANGFWKANRVTHRLEANQPGGNWFTEVECLMLDHSV